MSRDTVQGQRSYRRFLTLWAGQLLSGLGSGMTAFALGVYVFESSGSVTGFSMVILSLYAPSMLLKPLTGILADRLNRRYLIVAGDLGSALSVLALMLFVATPDPSLGIICLGVALASTFSSLREPSYKASITDLLGAEDFSRAGGLVQLASSAQHLLSPVAAGLLMSLASIRAVLLIDAVTFGVAILTTLVITRRIQTQAAVEIPRSVRDDLRGGWKAITGNRIVLRVVLVISGVTLFVGALQTLFGPMILTMADARTLGIVQSVSATGMVATSLVFGLVPVRRRHATILAGGLALAGLCMVIVGASTSIPIVTVAFFGFFAALPAVNTNAEVIIRGQVPNDRQGRAWGIIGFLSQLGYLTAYASAGRLADVVFEPLMAGDGPIATRLGGVIGSGPGRGIGLMLVLSGFFLVTLALVTVALEIRQKPVVSVDRAHLQKEISR